MAKGARTCWGCGYQQIGGRTFLGICTYFATIGKPNQDIPPGVVDVGCKLWKEKPPKVRGASGADEGA
jgi:hypothetical protein